MDNKNCFLLLHMCSWCPVLIKLKLLGIVLPHDGQCYVDSKGKYTHDAILDYPSISLVRQSIRENDVFVIFAVTSGQKSNYEELSKQLDPFSVTQGIDNENSITKVIEDQYKVSCNNTFNSSAQSIL